MIPLFFWLLSLLHPSLTFLLPPPPKYDYLSNRHRRHLHTHHLNLTPSCQHSFFFLIYFKGYTEEEAKAPAIALGIGLQITNILRDVGEVVS
jgi:hypothetical protein